MLSEAELAALTLRAPYVHEHADRPYFMHEINTVAAQLQEKPYLNYFVRYRSERADASKHRWSRVTEVVFLEDCVKAEAATTTTAAAAGSGAISQAGGRPALTIETNLSSPDLGSSQLPSGGLRAMDKSKAPAPGSTVVWRHKLFWVALKVVGEERPVYLPRLSHKLPSEEEVRQFCAYQSLSNPEETFSTAALAEAVVDEDKAAETSSGPVEASQDASDAKGEASVTSRVDPNALARTYLPTAEQIHKLRHFREAHITRHTWTTEETEEAARLHARYGDKSAGAAAAPMAATVNKVRNLQLESRLLGQSQGSQAVVAGGAGSGAMTGSQTQPSSSSFLASPPETPASPSAMATSQTLTQPQQAPNTRRNLRGQSVYTGRSPFLPKRLRNRPSTQGSQGEQTPLHSMGGDSLPQTSLFEDATPSSQLMPPSAEMQQSMNGSAYALSQPLPPSSATTTPVIDPETVEGWEEEYAQQLGFYRYITNGQRSGYINKIADITRRNAHQNRVNRLAGIAFEKTMDRKANFVESAGLWVTDDKLRAEKAAQYKAAQESEGTGKKEEKPAAPVSGANATAAAAAAQSEGAEGGEEAGDPAVAKARAERRAREAKLLEAFKSKHALQEIRFDNVPDAWLQDESLFQFTDGEGEGVSVRALSTGVSASSPYRLLVPNSAASAAATTTGSSGKRARSPPPSGTATLSPAARQRLITSQLLHRSAVSMAAAGGTTRASTAPPAKVARH